jgi:hypothetical protein
MTNNHSTRSTRVLTITTATRNGLVRSIGGELHTAFPHWLRNTADDFADLFDASPTTGERFARFVTGR